MFLGYYSFGNWGTNHTVQGSNLAVSSIADFGLDLAVSFASPVLRSREHPTPWTLMCVEPSTVNLEPRTPNPKPWTLRPELEALNPET